MSITIKTLHEDIMELKKEINDIKKAIIASDSELTPWAKKALKEARSEPLSSYTDLDDL